MLGSMSISGVKMLKIACCLILFLKKGLTSVLDWEIENENVPACFATKTEKAMDFYGAASLSCSVDVAFLIDSSGSMGITNFLKEKEFVRNMATFMGVPRQSRAAVVSFSTVAKVEINFSSYKSIQEFNDLTTDIHYSDGSTRIDLALLVAAREVFPYARAGAAKLALVLTDGKQTRHYANKKKIRLEDYSKLLQAQGVTVFAVGIGYQTSKKDLRRIVDSDEEVFQIDNFDKLLQSFGDIAERSCNVSGPQACSIGGDTRIRTGESNRNKNSENSASDQFFTNLTTLDAQDSLSLQRATVMMKVLLSETFVANVGTSSSYVSDFMCAAYSLEEFGIRFAEQHLNNTHSELRLENEEIVFQAKMFFEESKEDFVFPSFNTSAYETMLVLPKENFQLKGSLVVSTLYKDPHRSIPDLYLAETNGVRKLGTEIISVSLKPRRRELAKNITLRFENLRLLKPPLANESVCVFWDYSQLSSRGGSWSSNGCSILRADDVITECTCNHLTNFGVLMQIHDEKIPPTDERILSILTYIGIGISLLGCALTLLLYALFVNLRAQLSQIRVNLVLSIGIGQLIFIAGIDATRNMAGCMSVAAFIQYFYLVAFCWMLVEGVQLYLSVVKVFNVEHGMTPYYIFAWGFPAVVVIITVSVALSSEHGAAGYVHEQFCWLSFKNKLAWTFVGPVLVITLINIVLLVYVIRELSKMNSVIGSGDKTRFNTIRKTVKACLVLFPLLGVTWLFGMLTLTNIGVAAQYIFTILNSTQGFSIFVLNCLRNSEIRSKLYAKLQYFQLTMSHKSTTTPVSLDLVKNPPVVPLRDKRKRPLKNQLRVEPSEQVKSKS